MGTSRVFTGLQVGEFDDTQPIPKAFKVRHPEPFRLAARLAARLTFHCSLA